MPKNGIYNPYKWHLKCQFKQYKRQNLFIKLTPSWGPHSLLYANMSPHPPILYRKDGNPEHRTNFLINKLRQQPGPVSSEGELLNRKMFFKRDSLSIQEAWSFLREVFSILH